MTFETKVEKWGNSGWEVDVPTFCELVEENIVKKKKVLKKDLFYQEKTEIGFVRLTEEGRKGSEYIKITINDFEESITQRYDYETLVKFRNKLDNIIELFE